MTIEQLADEVGCRVSDLTSLELTELAEMADEIEVKS